jgi:hypothetical protein
MTPRNVLPCSEEPPLGPVLIHMKVAHIVTSYSTPILPPTCRSRRGLYLEDFRLKLWIHFSSLPCVLHISSIQHSWFKCRSNYSEEYKLWNYSLCFNLQKPATFSVRNRQNFEEKCIKATMGQLLCYIHWRGTTRHKSAKSNVCGRYEAGAAFGYQQWQWLSWLRIFMTSVSHCRQIQGLYFKISRLLPSTSSPVHY